MRKTQAAQIVARRSGVSEGRAHSLVLRATEAGLLPKGSGKHWPDLSATELAYLFLAIVADNGLGSVPASVRTFADLSDGSTTLHAALAEFFSSGPSLAGVVNGELIIRLDPATAALTAGGFHRRFGPEPPPGTAGRHVVVPGRALAAIGLEFQGRSPAEADELVALARITDSPSIGLAFQPTGSK